MNEKLIDNPELGQTVLVKIRVTMGFSQATLAWFKEIQKLYKESQIWFTEKEGDLIFSKFKSDWEKVLIDSAKNGTKEYFVGCGIPDEKLPSIKVTVYQYKDCLELMLVITIIGVAIQCIAEYPNIKKGIEELSKDIFKHIIDPIKTRLKERVSGDCHSFLNDKVSKLNLSSPPPSEEKLISIDVWLIVPADADISELVQLMFVGLMGAYKKVENILKNFHDKNDKPSHGFLFIESLVHQPLPKIDDECEANWGKILEKTWTFSPLPHRLARHSLFKTDKDIAKEDILIRLNLSAFTKHICKRWYDEEYDGNGNGSGLDFQKPNEIFIDNQEFRNLFFAILNKDIEIILIQKIEGLKKDEQTADINKKAALEYSRKCLEGLNGLLKDLRSLHSGEHKTMTCFLIPIASSQIFYGDMFVCVPHFDNDNKLKQLATDLIKCVKDHYVPALALIHEHFFEDLVTRNKKQKIEKDDLSIPYKLTLGEKFNVEMPDYKSPICRSIGAKEVINCYDCPYFGWEESSDNVVEKYLHKLWQDRRTERTDIKESLIFKNRLYTDPNMLDRLEDFFKPSKAKLKKDGDLLPSVLVVAPPGAGKDDVPNLLKLFTNCYNRGEIYKLNMASLKPDVITPVAMVGGKFTWEESNGKFHREETTKLKGILSEIREKTRKEFEDFYRDAGDEGLIKKSELYKNNLGKIIDNTINKNINKLQEKITEKLNKLDSTPDIDTDIKKKIEELATKLSSTPEVEPSKERRELEAEFRKRKELEDKKLAKIKELVAILSKQIKLRDKFIKVKEDAESLYSKLKGHSRLEDLELKEKEKLIVKELFGRFPTIVLDELNSMSLEPQGALLRFLENAEITPIGGYKDEMLVNGKVGKEIHKFFSDFLIVGIMNEDPEEITREEAIRFLQRERYVGGLLGDLLYEHILKIRRLRPDLRARMMRNGKFEIPELAERRADIPVSFYGIINKEKRDFFPNSKIRITMDSLELLMSSELEWTENFRLLQTLTKKIVEIIYEDYENKKKELIIIRENHIRKAMEALGMIKESRKTD